MSHSAAVTQAVISKAPSTLTRVNFENGEICKRRVKCFPSTLTLVNLKTIRFIGDRFCKASFFGDRKRRFSVDGLPNWGKKMRFQIYPGQCGRGLKQWRNEKGRLQNVVPFRPLN